MTMFYIMLKFFNMLRETLSEKVLRHAPNHVHIYYITTTLIY